MNTKTENTTQRGDGRSWMNRAVSWVLWLITIPFVLAFLAWIAWMKRYRPTKLAKMRKDVPSFDLFIRDPNKFYGRS